MKTVDEILTAAGVVHRETRFTKPPLADAYAIYMISKERAGSDDANRWTLYSASIELYTTTPNDDVEAALEAALDNYAEQMLDGWSCNDRVWIESEKLYMTVYEFNYITKG